VAKILNEQFVSIYYNVLQPDLNFGRLNGKTLTVFSPLLVVQASDGTELRRTTGYLPPEDMLLELKLCQGLNAMHQRDWVKAYDILDIAIQEHPSALNIPEALWWLGIAAFYRTDRNLVILAEAWAPIVKRHPESIWAQKADIFGPQCDCGG
jgi:hypothetical protein